MQIKCLILLSILVLTAGSVLDLTNAEIVLEHSAARSQRGPVYAQLLADEVQKRTALHWPVVNATVKMTTVSLGIDTTAGATSEGYVIRAEASSVSVWGHDERGLLFGVGRLLRLVN